jgi:hypothetical protein
VVQEGLETGNMVARRGKNTTVFEQIKKQIRSLKIFFPTCQKGLETRLDHRYNKKVRSERICPCLAGRFFIAFPLYNNFT